MEGYLDRNQVNRRITEGQQLAGRLALRYPAILGRNHHAWKLMPTGALIPVIDRSQTFRPFLSIYGRSGKR